MLRIPSLAAVLGLISVCASAQTLLRSVPGPAAGALYGKACLVIADQNGDGLSDLLVGAPGYSSQRGAVFCLSGAYLKFGTGSPHLWSVTPSANPGDMFGFAIADMGDATGDGVSEYVIGQPGYDFVNGTDAGVVRVLNGSNHSLMSLVAGGITTANFGPGSLFGSAIAKCGDSTGDGIAEVAIGAPGWPQSYVRLMNGASLLTSGSSLVGAVHTWNSIGDSAMGTAIVGGFDIDHDGFQDIAFGMPGYDGTAGSNTGAVSHWEIRPDGISPGGFYVSNVPGERMGSSLDARHDYNGDGAVDFVIGAPNYPDSLGGEAGRVVVVSGAHLASYTLPYDIRQLGGGGGFGFDYHFGAAVCASDDLNGDGVGDVLVGTPDYFTTVGFNYRGGVNVYSGATGASLSSFTGGSSDQLGDAFAGAVGDLDGDGFEEFVAAGSLSNAGGTDSGVVKCYRLFPTAPITYCTGKVNSLGCTPSISSSGTPSATSGSPFLVTASNFINQTPGLLFYSHAPTATPFQGGTKCVASPTTRTPLQNSGGSVSGSDCTGTFSLDFNARIQAGVDPTLVAGAEVFCQHWARDAQSASTTSLSNALRFLIAP